MLKYAKIENEKTKSCCVGLGTDKEFYISIGMTEMDVEQAYDGSWYIAGYAPQKPDKLILEEKINELKELLKEKDYIGVKIATGVATIDEYREEIALCEQYRNEIRRLEEELEKTTENCVVNSVAG